MEKIFKPSEDQEKSLEKWKTEDVVFWAKKHFSEDVALNLKGALLLFSITNSELFITSLI